MGQVLEITSCDACGRRSVQGICVGCGRPTKDCDCIPVDRRMDRESLEEMAFHLEEMETELV